MEHCDKFAKKFYRNWSKRNACGIAKLLMYHCTSNNGRWVQQEVINVVDFKKSLGRKIYCSLMLINLFPGPVESIGCPECYAEGENALEDCENELVFVD